MHDPPSNPAAPPDASKPHRNTMTLRSRLGRELIKKIVSPMLRWNKLLDPQPGYSLIIGTPWSLHHLLPVNLRFVQRTQRTNLHRIFVVFDRRKKPGADAFVQRIRREFSDLPLEFLFYRPVSGAIMEKVDVSTFYNSMNTVLGLSQVRSRYAILHDFDLYPLVPDYFEKLHASLRDKQLHFTGLERTHFDGLNDDDNLLGTWALGIDVAWLRNHHKPIEAFHKVAQVHGRLINLDPYSHLQLQTDKRALAEGIDGSAACHVKNLCSTYLRFTTGRRAKVAWRLHYLWYLEDLALEEDRLSPVIEAMDAATARGETNLRVYDYEADFAGTDPTCANVLSDELNAMEKALHGQVRPLAQRYAESFRRFLEAAQHEPATSTQSA